MSRTGKAWRSWQIGLAGVLACLGCQTGDHSLPRDPLFVSRKPVEAKPELAAPVTVAFAEPVMPVDPIVALAKRNTTEAVPAVLTGNPGFFNRMPQGPARTSPPPQPE
jgi:hypothetical protein